MSKFISITYLQKCAEFLEHVLYELDGAFVNNDEMFEHAFPVYVKWLNEALGYCGHTLGSSFQGQRNWEAWHGPAKAKKKKLLDLLKAEASAKDLKALKVSLEE